MIALLLAAAASLGRSTRKAYRDEAPEGVEWDRMFCPFELVEHPGCTATAQKMMATALLQLSSQASRMAADQRRPLDRQPSVCPPSRTARKAAIAAASAGRRGESFGPSGAVCRFGALGLTHTDGFISLDTHTHCFRSCHTHTVACDGRYNHPNNHPHRLAPGLR